jgi:hypothetical protein
MGKNELKMLYALRAKGVSRHARAHNLTSNFSKFSGGEPPPAGGGHSLPHAPPLGTSCLALRIILQALATPLLRPQNILYQTKSV